MRAFLIFMVTLGVILILSGFMYSFTTQAGLLVVIVGAVITVWSAVDLAFLPTCHHPHGGDPDWF